MRQLRVCRPTVLAMIYMMAPAMAADPLVSAGTDAVLTLGVGARVQPSFEGGSSYLLSPMPIVSLKFLRSPFTGEPTGDTGFGIYPSFRFDSRRPGTGKLAGLSPVAASAEIGLGFDYTDTYWRGFVELRQGVGGQHGVTADVGVDAIAHPDRRLTIAAGPRLSLASSDYMRSYFGVTPAESLASAGNFTAFKPGGGIRGAGIGGNAVYEIDPRWQIRADAGWMHLLGDAARSPIVRKAGSADQLTLGLGVAYRFGFGWH